MIIIHRPGRPADEQLLRDIGFSGLRKIADDSFDRVIHPEGQRVYMGTYGDNILICTADMPMQFFEEVSTPVEKRLNELFPASEICAIVLHSVVDLWGFSVTVNGRKIRAKAGSADDGTFLELGTPLEEELDLLSTAQLDEDGNRVYPMEDPDEGPLPESAVGEEYVFSISKRYLGESLDDATDELFDMMMMGYAYEKMIGAVGVNTHVPKDGDKPWWKFW